MLYNHPPASLTALQIGREREPQATARYLQYQRADGALVTVEKCGLFVHPSGGYLAASPDRLVEDPSCSPSDGIMEIKILTKATVPPQEHAQSGKCAYLKIKYVSVQLLRTHNYYYQVQCQLSCTGQSWCDFAVMSFGAPGRPIWVERIYPDPQWHIWQEKARNFYLEHYSRELLYPTL